jgi:hypothetical protein
MKYILGSLIISFGLLLVAIVVMMAMNIQAPDGGLKMIGLAWLGLAIVCYPLARKLVR